MGPGDNIIAMRPFFWVGGLAAQLFYCLHVGACHVSLDGASDAAILAAIVERGANALAGDESWFQQLRHAPTLLDAGYEIVELNAEFAGVARRNADGALSYISANLAERNPTPEHLEVECFPWTFGMTEFIGAHTSLKWGAFNPADRPRVSGRSVPGVQARICDPETHAILPPGVAGELEVRGYSMMLGMDGRERGDIWTEDGYYRTDDLAMMDADGFITLIGRLGDGFKVKGANVAPLEVEMALYGFTEVERCCVLGVPRDQHRTDNAVVAVVQLRTGAQFDADAIRTALKSQLSNYKVPEHILIFAAQDIPVTGSGKVKRNDLLTRVTERLAGMA